MSRRLNRTEIQRLANHLERGEVSEAKDALARLKGAAQTLGERIEVYKGLTRGRDAVATSGQASH